MCNSITINNASEWWGNALPSTLIHNSSLHQERERWGGGVISEPEALAPVLILQCEMLKTKVSF